MLLLSNGGAFVHAGGGEALKAAGAALLLRQ
jgi:hypothetical protein